MKLLEVLDEVEIDNFLVPTYKTKGWVLCNHTDGFVDLFLGKGVILRNVEANALRVCKKTVPKVRLWVIEAIRLILVTQHEHVHYLQEIKQDPPRIIQNRIDDIVFLTGRGLNHAVFSTFIKSVTDIHNLHYESQSYKQAATDHITELCRLRNSTTLQKKNLETVMTEKHVLMESLSKHTFENQSKREFVNKLQAEKSELEKQMEVITSECDSAVLRAMDLEKENKDLLSDYEELRGKYAQLLANQHKSDIESDKLIMDLDTSLAESKVLSKKVEKLKEKVKMADGKIELLTSEKTHQLHVEAHYTAEIMRLEAFNKEQRAKFKQLEEEHEVAVVELGGLKGRLEFKEEELDRMKVELDELRNSQVEHRLEKDKLRADMEHQRMRTASLQTQISELKAHHEHEIARKEGDIKMLQETHMFARKQIARMKGEIEELMKEKEKAAEKISALYQIEMELQSKLADFHFQHETLKIDHTQALKKLARSDKDAKHADDRMDKVTADTQLLRHLVSSLQQNHKTMGSQLGRWRSKLDTASENIETMALESMTSSGVQA